MNRASNLRKEIKRRRRNMKILMAAIVIFMLFTIVGSQVIFNFNDTEYIIKVTDKDRVYGSGDSSSSKYLVFGDDENENSLVFENTDCFIRFKWNSSNIQGHLKEGNTYKITVVGYRVPFFSMYQNIIKVEEVK